MGNCVTSTGILVHYDEKDEQPREAEAIEKVRRSISATKSEPEMHVNGGKKKTVRFKLHEEHGNGKESHGYSKGGAVRIRVVVTQKELIQILSNDSKYTSVGQLLSAMKLKSRKISQVRISRNGGWKPALESIPED